MNRVKASIDEQLEHFVVTDDLKERTLKRLNSQLEPRKRPFRLNVITKGLTLVASLTMVVFLGINFVFQSSPLENAELRPFEWTKGMSSDPFSDRYHPQESIITSTEDTEDTSETTEEDTEEQENDSELKESE